MSRLLFIWAITALCLMCVFAQQGEDDPMTVAVGKHLFLDATLFQSTDGFTRTLNPATRDPEPVLVSEAPWEAACVWWHNTIMRDDDGLIKLYYCAFTEDKRRHMCLATSADGIHFERPNCGVVEFDGSTDNNIVLTLPPGSLFAGTVFKAPSAPPDERYKLIFDGEPLGHAEGTPGYLGIRGAHSPDGIHWTIYDAERIVPWYTDTQNHCMWDDRLGKYVAYLRYNEGYTYADHTVSGKFGWRCVARTESDDFLNFPTPVKVLDPEPAGTDLRDHKGWMDLYNPVVVKYPATDAYLMMPSAYYHYGLADKLDVALAVSRDGIAWELLPGTFVRLGPKGSWDSERIYMAVGMVPAGDEIWLYYCGMDRDHSSRSKPYPPGFGAIGRARLRLDGFVSLDAGPDGGTLVTRPFVMPAERILLNMDAGAGGHLMIEFLDEAGAPIKGYSGMRSGPIVGNSVRMTGRLRNGVDFDFAPLVGRTLRMSITGRNVKFYSMSFLTAEDYDALAPPAER